MKRFLKYALTAVGLVSIVVLLFLGSLFFREQRLPRSWVKWAASRVSTTNLVVTCESAAFGFRRGLDLKNIAVYDTTRRDALSPLAEAGIVSVNCFTREVRAVGVRFPRLPDSYYAPGYRERNEPLEFDFPEDLAFGLVLERPEILGVKPERVSAQVTTRKKMLALDDIHVAWWPTEGEMTAVDGQFRVDLIAQRITGEVHGLATQAEIRPLLEVLDITSSLPYVDAFTELPKAVPAHAQFDIDLVRGDFGMNLALQPKMGKYRGLPMTGAEGTVDVRTGIRGTNCNVRLDVDLASAVDPQGRRLSGHVGVTDTNDVVRLSFDARSRLPYADVLTISEFLTPDDLPFLTCDTAPVLLVKGTCGTSLADKDHNDLSFDVRLKQGSLWGFRLNDAQTHFTLKGDELDFREFTAKGRTGGAISALGTVRFPDFDSERTAFTARIDYTDGSLEELAEFFRFDPGERDGKVKGWCELSGPATTNFAARLNGRGRVDVTDGHLARLNLFAGLTSLMAEKVPGVDFLVNQSQASADFTITNGVVSTDNLYIEGGVVSLKGWGAYDIARDSLDATVRVQFMKKDSLMGKLLHPMTFPFTKLLLEFKASGTIDNPQWSYISIIDRIL